MYIKKIVLLAILVVSFSNVALAQTWDNNLAVPPVLSEEVQVVAALEAVAEKPKVVLASEHEKEKNFSSDIIGELRLTSLRSRDKGIQGNLFTKQLFLEKPLGGEFSVYTFLYDDQEFQTGSVGLAKKFGNWQFGLGIGSAKYDGLSRLVINPWLYYDDGLWKGLITADRYSKEPGEPWFYKGHIERKVGENFLAGAYGEKGSGIGPMIGFYITDGFKVWLAVPVVDRPNDGSGYRLFLGTVLEF